jgi:hypothetical protein
MSYHDLSECTLDADERAEEACRILTIITTEGKMSMLSDNDVDFLSSVCLSNYNVTVKQLFFLRDIKERVLR